MPSVAKSRYLVFAALAIGGCLLDLGTKALAFGRLGMPGGEPWWIIPGHVGFETSLNEGALFGIGQGGVGLFVALSAFAAVAVVWWLFWKGAAVDFWLTAALGTIMGGILGNLYDRLGIPGLLWNYPAARVGQPVFAVRDFILFRLNSQLTWPNFNVADSLLVVGALALVVHAFFVPAGATDVKSGAKPKAV